MYVHSPFKHWPKGSEQIQVAAYEYPDLSNHWIIVRANMSHTQEGKGVEENEVFSEIPERLQYLHHGDWIRLRHVAHRHCMHSHDVRTMGRINNKRHCEISAYGFEADDFDDDNGDWWRVEVVNTDTMRTVSKKVEGLRVKALDTAFRLRQYSQGCHLHLTGDLLDDSVSGGEGRVELSCLKDAAVLTSSIWRFSMNDHDYRKYHHFFA
jgi:dolichyl-phosphate-mannose-protein mannosyltransferase